MVHDSSIEDSDILVLVLRHQFLFVLVEPLYIAFKYSCFVFFYALPILSPHGRRTPLVAANEVQPQHLFGDLDGIQGGALAKVVAHDPNR